MMFVPTSAQASAAARTCDRDVAGGNLADRDPATARARRSRDHLPVPPRHRQHRDHRGCASASRADDPCKQTARSQPLTRADHPTLWREAGTVRCLTPSGGSKQRPASRQHAVPLRRQCTRALRRSCASKAITRRCQRAIFGSASNAPARMRQAVLAKAPCCMRVVMRRGGAVQSVVSGVASADGPSSVCVARCGRIGPEVRPWRDVLVGSGSDRTAALGTDAPS